MPDPNMKPSRPRGLKPQTFLRSDRRVRPKGLTPIVAPKQSDGAAGSVGSRLQPRQQVAQKQAGALAPEVLKSFALAGVRFYQAALRPLNPWGCKFYPSCSHYALEAVERYGVSRGAWLALKRILRCRPGVFGGYDPVPESPNPE